jgi:hypothetical protein
MSTSEAERKAREARSYTEDPAWAIKLLSDAIVELARAVEALERRKP